MKPANKFFILPCVVLALAGLAGCSKPAADVPETSEAPATAGVRMDAETRERIGLKLETPAPAQWQPRIHATGHAADPLAFTAAATEYEMARAAAAASQRELERTQKLAEQENASPRALEAAQVTAARDALALTAARAKFTADWGPHLAAQTNLTAFADKLETDNFALVKLQLPAGTFPSPFPSAATVFVLSNETNGLAAEFADDLRIDPATQVQTLLYSLHQKLPPGVAVTAQLKVPGEPANGVLVPESAILRHEGRGWVYVQAETNRFVRVEVPLDRFTGGGWFVSENIWATNRLVVVGAQTILSTELSSGGFNTGQRD